ncbi:MAG: hypothetical protein PUP92_09700 [Rhizonema sp. PD38]|nr:hypothetical protein [Rhizonema sp. PD38]
MESDIVALSLFGIYVKVAKRLNLFNRQERQEHQEYQEHQE